MDHIKLMVDSQLTEREIIIYLLVQSGMSYRDLAKRLLTSHSNVQRAYQAADKKMSKMSEVFSTPIKN